MTADSERNVTEALSVDDRFLEVPGGSVFVRKWTPSTGANDPPVILLHDSLGSVELWRDFPENLARHLNRRVIAYDRIGFGRSSARHDVLSHNFIGEEARIYFPMIRKALGITQYALFGHSVGGSMALTIASIDHKNCIAVVSESAQTFVEERTLNGIREATAAFKEPDQFARLARRHGEKANWVLSAWRDVWLSPNFADWSLKPILPLVHCPILAIHGDQDEFGTTAFPKVIVDLVAGPSKLVIFEGCGHVPHREWPDKVLNCTTAFLNEVLTDTATSEDGSH